VKESYFAAMGWDIRTGIPSKRTLTELGLEMLVTDLK
jgi:aldehyde:ferredoxin oxidoreductase